MQLNPEQKTAVAAREGAYVVLACPGAGKTRVLTERIKSLLAEGVSLDEILALTFTAEAAAELLRRLGIKNTDLRGGARTFHSLGYKIVRAEHRFVPYGLSSEPFPAGNVLYKLLVDCMKQFGVNRKAYQEIKHFISKQKRQRIPPEDSDVYNKIYGQYEKRLRDGGMLDFDGMIVEAVNLLEKYNEVADRWQFRWVHCDEAQDTDDLQFRFLQLVSRKYGNVMCVGDFCQALYSFRGARPENLINFTTWFPDARKLILPLNYRSTPEILAFFKSDAPIRNELTENMKAVRSSVGIPIRFRKYDSDTEEAERILDFALTDPGNSAILARTNFQLAPYESLCTEKNIKFCLLGRSGFWTQTEVKNFVRLMDWLLSPRPATTYSQECILPLRGFARQRSAAQMTQQILEWSGLTQMYSNEDYEEDDNFALDNLRRLIQISTRFPQLSDFSKHAHKAEHASRKSKNALHLSTIHQYKGLEQKNVFVIGVNQGKLPHERGDFDEENRIWYVARSRAADSLTVSFVGTPSVFIQPFLTAAIKEEMEQNRNKVETLQTQLFA